MEGALQELATLGTMREITVQFHHETLPRVRDWLKYSSLVRFAFMNAREFHEFTGLSAKSIHTLPDVPGCLGETEFIVTSPDTCWLIGRRQLAWFSTPRLEHVIDATGAGDIFAGAFLSVVDVDQRFRSEGTLQEGVVRALAHGRAVSASSLMDVGSRDVWQALTGRCE